MDALSHKSISKARAKLTQSDALDIYNYKGSVTSAAVLSKLYGVSEKAVRDIWTGRTWSKETWHLDDSRPYPAKKMGRPFGRKDAQPRKPRGLRPITELCSLQTTDHSILVSPESQSTEIECKYSIVMNLWPEEGEKNIEEAHKDTEELPSSVLEVAVKCGNQSIDDLLHAKTRFGFDTKFEDPFGPDWMAVHRSFSQSMW